MTSGIEHGMDHIHACTSRPAAVASGMIDSSHAARTGSRLLWNRA